MAFGITYEVVTVAAEHPQAQSMALNTVVDGMKTTADRHFAEWSALSVEARPGARPAQPDHRPQPTPVHDQG